MKDWSLEDYLRPVDAKPPFKDECMYFCGCPMMQHPNAIRAFGFFLSEQKFEQIIEIGFGHGGLSAVIAFAAVINNSKFYTYDIEVINYDIISKVEQLGGKVTIGDVFNNIKEIEKIIQSSGRTLILCDGGNKIEEVKTFSKFMKPDDVIMAHDYFSNQKVYDTNLWRSCEITDKDLTETEEYLEPYYKKLFDGVVWMCRRKKEINA